MPRPDVFSTDLHAEAVGSNPFDALITDLANSMRRYDALATLRDEITVPPDPFIDINLELPLHEHPEKIAFLALEWQIIQKKRLILANAGEQEKDSASDAEYNFRRFIGYRVLVESTDPSKYTLGTSITNRHGHQDGLGQWHQSRTGKLADFNFNRAAGGSLTLTGWLGKIYSAFPIVDRQNNYTPGFRVTFI